MSAQQDSNPELVAYFEMIVRASETREEAAPKLGYSTSTLYRHMKSSGIQNPRDRPSAPNSRLTNQHRVPEIVITNVEERPWVGALVQGEGCFYPHYVKTSDSTTLAIETRMTDPEPIFKFSDLCGMPRPSRPRLRPGFKPIWRKGILGIRALRIAREIQPFLFGEKKEEAEKAIVFFGPHGYHRGRFNASDVWPSNQFQLRRKGCGSGPPREEFLDRPVDGGNLN
jgi:hypothetical protein